jgi:hypothetical protein
MMEERAESQGGHFVITDKEIEEVNGEIDIQNRSILALREEINMMNHVIASGRIDQLWVQWGPRSKAENVHMACVGCLGEGRKEGTLREAFLADFGEFHFICFPYEYERLPKQ